MKIGEFKKIIKDIDDDKEMLLAIPHVLKYVHHVKKVEIDPLSTNDEVLKGILIIGYEHF